MNYDRSEILTSGRDQAGGRCDLIRKAFRALDEFELEETGTIRDRINRAEKRNLVKTTEDLIKIRILRNEIVHEYLPETMQELFKEVLSLTPVLLEIAGNTVDYALSAITASKP